MPQFYKIIKFKQFSSIPVSHINSVMLLPINVKSNAIVKLSPTPTNEKQTNISHSTFGL